MELYNWMVTVNDEMRRTLKDVVLAIVTALRTDRDRHVGQHNRSENREQKPGHPKYKAGLFSHNTATCGKESLCSESGVVYITVHLFSITQVYVVVLWVPKQSLIPSVFIIGTHTAAKRLFHIHNKLKCPASITAFCIKIN